MKSVKKLMLVDPRVLAKMKESNTQKPPLVKVVTDLDTQINEALSRTDLSTSEKVKLCDQILQRCIVYKEKLTEKPDQVVVSEKKDFPESEILGGVTKQYKKMKSFSTLLRATLLWVGTILVSLFMRTDVPTSSHCRQRHGLPMAS